MLVIPVIPLLQLQLDTKTVKILRLLCVEFQLFNFSIQFTLGFLVLGLLGVHDLNFLIPSGFFFLKLLFLFTVFFIRCLYFDSLVFWLIRIYVLRS